MFNQLTALGYGITVFAIVIGVGVVVLGGFTSATACNTAPFTTYNATNNVCANGTYNSIAVNTGGATTYYLMGQMGTSGLASWTPAIIAISVGILFLGAFMVGKGNKARY